MELKKSLRKKFLESRNKYSIKEQFIANNVIVKNTLDVINSLRNFNNKRFTTLVDHDVLDNRHYLGLYWPMIGEPDLLKLVINSGYSIAIPKLKGIKMEFVKYEPNGDFEKSGFRNLMQPVSNKKVHPNIIIMPGLAFSVKGTRLGFGMGHYDRYIAKVKNNRSIIKIGVCFHKDLYEYLPSESHDIKLDYIITNKTTIIL